MTIKLFGDIVSDDWVWLYDYFGIPCCSPKNVRDAIAELPQDEDLILEVNSPGGDCWAGFEIFGLLQQLGERAEAHIISMAASAATTITSACARVLASPVAQIMIHQPSVDPGTVNNEGAKQLKNFLDSVKASIINGYVIKCGGKTSRHTLEKLVDGSTWMPAQDAIELGLVDGYLDTTEETEDLLSSYRGIGVTNAAPGATSTMSLLERYEANVRAGIMNEAPGHPVSRESVQEPKAAPTEARNTAAPEEDPAITVNREIVENTIADWRLKAAIDLERERGRYDEV